MPTDQRPASSIPAVRSKTTGVLFISSAEQPGADTFIHTLIMRSLDRSRFDLHVACSAGPPEARTPGYQILQAIPDLHLRPANFGPSLTGLSTTGKIMQLLGSASTMMSVAGLVRYIKQHRISVLHATDRPRDAVACALLGKLSGAKSIIHAHLKCADWMGKSLRWSMGQVDGLIGVSQFVVDSLIECGYDSAKTHAVLNAIDLPRWDFRLSGDGVRQELGIPAGAPVIACAARIFRGKGQDELLKAVPAVRDEFPDVRVLIIGRDDLQAQPKSFTADLKVLAAGLGVTDNVIFTGQRADMPAVMAACDVFALPSWEEPFGLVYAEAMAMKKPVVALNNGGTLEVVDHGRSGLLAPFGDPGAFAAHLRTLLRDPALRAQMGEYGRRQVEARFCAERMARDVGSVYATLTSSDRSDRVTLERGVTTS